MGYNPGEMIDVFVKVRGGWKSKRYKVVQETDKFITITNGMYKNTINKYNLKTGRVEIEKVESEVPAMGAKQKITDDQLLQEIKEHGLNKKTKEFIAQQYNIGLHTVDYRIDALRESGKLKDVLLDDFQGKDIKGTDVLINEGSKKVENKNSKLPHGRILVPSDFKGKIMNYRIYENNGGFTMKRPNGTTVMPMDFSEVEDLIRELQELCKVNGVVIER
jgi:hypothetical protein